MLPNGRPRSTLMYVCVDMLLASSVSPSILWVWVGSKAAAVSMTIVLVLAIVVGCILAPWPSHLILSCWGIVGISCLSAARAAADTDC